MKCGRKEASTGRAISKFVIASVLLPFLLFSVASYAQTPTPQTMVPGNFVEVTDAVGVHFQHQAPHTSKKYLIETMGSGVALFDYDNDGRLDLFLATGAPFSYASATSTVAQQTAPEYWNRPNH